MSIDPLNYLGNLKDLNTDGRSNLDHFISHIPEIPHIEPGQPIVIVPVHRENRSIRMTDGAANLFHINDAVVIPIRNYIETSPKNIFGSIRIIMPYPNNPNFKIIASLTSLFDQGFNSTDYFILDGKEYVIRGLILAETETDVTHLNWLDYRRAIERLERGAALNKATSDQLNKLDGAITLDTTNINTTHLPPFSIGRARALGSEVVWRDNPFLGESPIMWLDVDANYGKNTVAEVTRIYAANPDLEGGILLPRMTPTHDATAERQIHYSAFGLVRMLQLGLGQLDATAEGPQITARLGTLMRKSSVQFNDFNGKQVNYQISFNELVAGLPTNSDYYLVLAMQRVLKDKLAYLPASVWIQARREERSDESGLPVNSSSDAFSYPTTGEVAMYPGLAELLAKVLKVNTNIDPDSSIISIIQKMIIDAQLMNNPEFIDYMNEELIDWRASAIDVTLANFSESEIETICSFYALQRYLAKTLWPLN